MSECHFIKTDYTTKDVQMVERWLNSKGIRGKFTFTIFWYSSGIDRQRGKVTARLLNHTELSKALRQTRIALKQCNADGSAELVLELGNKTCVLYYCDSEQKGLVQSTLTEITSRLER